MGRGLMIVIHHEPVHCTGEGVVISSITESLIPIGEAALITAVEGDMLCQLDDEELAQKILDTTIRPIKSSSPGLSSSFNKGDPAFSWNLVNAGRSDVVKVIFAGQLDGLSSKIARRAVER